MRVNELIEMLQALPNQNALVAVRDCTGDWQPPRALRVVRVMCTADGFIIPPHKLADVPENMRFEQPAVILGELNL